MNIKKTLIQATQQLKSTQPKSAPLDAEILLAHALGKTKEYLYTHPDHKLTTSQQKKFNSYINRRKKHEPIAYITGHKEFFGLDFLVDKNVLIPRPESELLVEETLKTCRGAKSCASGKHTIIDIGTGSSCIAISLAKHLPKAKIIATDSSKPALHVAKKNAHRHKTASRIKFLHGNLLEPLSQRTGARFCAQIVIANLPYGWHAWKNNTSAETKGLAFEPPTSLFTEEHGLKLYRQLLEQIQKLKNQPKYILLEHDPRQTTELKKMIKKHLPKSKIKSKKDLAGKNRVVIIKI